MARNITKASQTSPLTPADMTIDITEGVRGNALNQAEFVGLAPAGTPRTERGWQLKKLIYSVNGVLSTQFPVLSGVPSSGYIFALDTVPQIQEMAFVPVSRGHPPNLYLHPGNIITVTINGGTPIAQPFITSTFSTIDALGVQMEADPDIISAVNTNGTSLTITGGFAVAQVQTFTLDAALVTGNIISVIVDDWPAPVTRTFNTDSNTTLLNFAADLELEPGIVSAVVTDGGAGTDDDRIITITSANPGSPAVLTDASVTGGATQAGIAIVTTVENKGRSFVLSDITITVDAVDSQVVVTETDHGQLNNNLLTYLLLQ